MKSFIFNGKLKKLNFVLSDKNRNKNEITGKTCVQIEKKTI